MLNRKYFKTKISLAIIFVFLAAFSIFNFHFSKDVKADATPSLTGYAWSSNIGWISFTPSTNGNNTITVDPTTGNINGYAWSENIGWVKFGGLGAGADANYNFSTGAITGWARACAGSQNGDCSTSASRTDGWDGGISLSGTGYGVSGTQVSTTAQLSGYAWGSDVVGWVDFSNASIVNLPAVPVIPSTFVLSVSGSSCLPSGVSLSWSSVSGASTYNIYRSDLTTNSSYSILKTGITSNSFSDSGSFNSGDIYSYEITAVNSINEESLAKSSPVQSNSCGTNICTNGATNWPSCNLCQSPKYYIPNVGCAFKSTSPNVSSFSIIPNTIAKGGNCNLSWTLDAGSIDASSTCSIYKGSTLISPPSPFTPNMNGTYTATNVSSETKYTLTCGESGAPASIYMSRSATCNINQNVKEVNQ